MSFDNVFGGGTLQTTEVAYRAFSFSADVTLTWPQYGGADYAARTMDATPTAAGLSLTLPAANQVSTGYDLLISNRGASPFSVKNAAGTMVVTVGVGESKYVQVTNNSSEAGAWNSIAFGAVPAAADAASLAGYGVAASGSTLIASQPTSTFSSNYTVIASDRARTYVWTGGSGTLSLTAFGTLGSDFWFEVRNQGSGALTIDPSGAEQIDGSSTIVLQPTESCIVHAGASAWYTVGRGRSVQFSFTLLVKGITGGTVTLTSTEAANVVQRYTGVLVSNADIVLPSVVQVYYVSNQTTGAFTVTFKTSGVGTTVSVPTGQNAVLFCDGLNVVNSSTTISGITSLVLSAGAASSPSLTYSGDTTTGLYQPVSGQVAVTIAGVQRGLFSAAGLNVTGSVAVTAAGSFAGQLSAPGGLALNGAATLPAQTTGGLFSFEVPVIREYIGDGTGYSRAWSKRIAGVTTDLMKLSDVGTLTVTSTSSIANWGSSTVAGSFSTYYEGGTTTAVGYIGTDGGAIIGGGTGLNFGMRAEGSLYLMSASGAKLLAFDTAGTLYPNTTNSYSLGGTSNRWSNVASVLGDFSGAVSVGGTLIGNSLAKFPAANAGFEIGSNTAVNTPFIDFHTMNRDGDFDVRLIASGGGAGDGQGLLNIAAASVGIDCVPSGFKLDLGTLGAGSIGGVANMGGYSDAGAYTIWAGRTPSNGAIIQLYGGSHATNPGLLVFGAGGVGRLQIAGDGRVYGTALHNNPGAVTGTTNQYVASGTYTATPIAGTNTTVPGGFQGACWTRVGNVVTVSGAATFSMTSANTFSEVDIPLPIASTNLSGLCNGTAVQDAAFAATANLAACIGPSGIADRARLYIANASGLGATGNRLWRWQLTYLVE